MKKNEKKSVVLKTHTNGLWYVVDTSLNLAIVITMTKDEAVARCEKEGWEIKEAA